MNLETLLRKTGTFSEAMFTDAFINDIRDSEQRVLKRGYNFETVDNAIAAFEMLYPTLGWNDTTREQFKLKLQPLYESE